jgi:hypothetical protein
LADKDFGAFELGRRRGGLRGGGFYRFRPFDELRSFDELRMIGMSFDKLRPFDELRPFDRLRMSGGGGVQLYLRSS